MTHHRPLVPTALLAALALVGGACSSTDAASGDRAAPSEPSASTTTTTRSPSPSPPTSATSGTDRPATTDGDVTALARAVVESIGGGYERSIGVWDGFDPREHPTVVPVRDDGEIVSALAINHPEPDALGSAYELATDGTPIESAYLVRNLDEGARERLAEVPNFDFHAELGGVDSFVMVADQGDEFLDPTRADWVATYLHEMFHRFQDRGFEGRLGDQDVDGYAYTPENLRLAVLEDRSLADALASTDDVSVEAAARRFAALRLARRSADARVGLDDRQEMFEGTARALEHLQAGDDTRFAYHSGNWDRDLLTEIPGSSVKDQFGFGRFYASGAAIHRVAERLGVEDIARRVNGGAFLADLLIDHLDVGPDDVARLVSDAESTYDPADELSAAAQEAADAAADEGPVFGNDADPTGAGHDPSGELALTDAQVDCLREAGVGEGGEITDAVFEECVGSG